MCPWSFISLTSFNCFFKSIRISWSNFYQLHVLMLTLSTHDIMIFGWMNGKLASENLFWKWISRKEKIIKWMFQTLAITSKLNNFTNMGFYGFLFSIPVLTRKKTKHYKSISRFMVPSPNSYLSAPKGNSKFKSYLWKYLV